MNETQSNNKLDGQTILQLKTNLVQDSTSQAGSLYANGIKYVRYMIFPLNPDSTMSPLLVVKDFSVTNDYQFTINDTINWNINRQARIVLLASDQPFEQNIPGHLYYGSSTNIMTPSNTSDLFYGHFDLMIDTTGTIVRKNMTLSRIVGKLDVVIKDADKLPTDIDSIRPKMNGIHPILFDLQTEKVSGQQVQDGYDSYGFGGYTGELSDLGVNRAKFTANKEYTFSMYMLDNTDLSNTDLYLTYFSKGKEVGSKLIKQNIKIYRNKRVKLTGNLFGGNGGWAIEINNRTSTDREPIIR